MREEKTLILVIGAPRSGTSAVAGSLAAAGIQFGDNLIPPKFDNQKGFFENLGVVDLHDQLFASIGASWDNPSGILLEPNGAVEGIAAVIRALPGPVCAVKDPRACFFVNLWRDACIKEGVRLCVLDVGRHQPDSMRSLMKREGWGAARARILVDEYEYALTQAEFSSSEAWSQIEFPMDLTNPAEWQRIFRDFNLESDADDLCSFFDPSLVHHNEVLSA